MAQCIFFFFHQKKKKKASLKPTSHRQSTSLQEQQSAERQHPKDTNVQPSKKLYKANKWQLLCSPEHNRKNRCRPVYMPRQAATSLVITQIKIHVAHQRHLGFPCNCPKFLHNIPMVNNRVTKNNKHCILKYLCVYWLCDLNSEYSIIISYRYKA